MTSTNPFAVFNDAGDSDTSCPMRKAHKKLREIEKLKHKMNKTPEEYTKIREESIWRAIVEPVLTGATTTPEEIKQRKNKQRENTQIKELKRKLNNQKENQQLKKGNSSPRSYFNYNADSVSMEEKVEEEFLELYQQKGSYKETYKEMILKYHPDKNNTDIGHKITTILNTLRQRYKD